MEKIRLRFSDFASAVPPEHLLCELPGEEFIAIDATAALSHIVPRISLRALAQERPDLFLPSDTLIKLPAHRIAEAYRVLEESYEPNSDAAPEGNPSPLPSGNFSEATQNLDRISKNQTLPVQAEPFKPHTPPVETTPVDSHTDANQPLRLIELIQSLPTFHRLSPAPAGPALIEPLVLETENPSTDIPEQDKLQALFLTDEKLTVRRVVELCGELPGIQSCVLTREDGVVASHNLPKNLDLLAMSSTASKMLAAMQESSSQLGIGAIPALTLHTERGPLSIIQNNRLTMLVIHSDRGFIPGVREKLTTTLSELSRTPLALPSAAFSRGMPLPPASE